MLTNPEPFGAFDNGSPRGNAERHLELDEIVARFDALPPAPKEQGTLRYLTQRKPSGPHVSVTSVGLDASEGMLGDKWAPGSKDGTENQVTLMRFDVAELLANGQGKEIFGDNLLVDLDLSEANLPTGTRLRVGAVLLEVTGKPHTGCAKFKQRIGEGGLRLTAMRPRRADRLRGIHGRVIEGGEVTVGDAIEVLR